VTEKDETIEKKSKQIGVLAADKKRLDAEITEIKDQLDVRDRKLGALQRKVRISMIFSLHRYQRLM